MKHLLALLLSIGLLAGCRRAAPSNEVRVSVFGELDTYQIMEARAQAFNAQAKDCRVKVDFVPYSQYFEKLTIQFSAGQAPDVVWVESSNFNQLQALGLFVSLTPFIERDKLDLKAYYPGVTRRFNVGGVQYGIPQDTAPVACVYYNQDMFRAAGLPYPKDDWTWAQFLATAKALTQHGSDGRVSVYGYTENYGPDWQPWVFSNGANAVDDEFEPRRCTLDSPAAIEGVQFMADLMNKHGVMPKVGQGEAFSGLGQDLFANNKVAMLHSGIWVVPALRKIKGFTWDMAALPRGPRAKVPGWGSGGSGWAITRDCKKVEKAWQVVKFFCGEDTQAAFAKIGYVQPALMKLAASDAFTKAAPPAHKAFMVTAPNFAHYVPGAPKWNEAAATCLNPRLDLVWKGQWTSEKALKEATQEINTKFFTASAAPRN